VICLLVGGGVGYTVSRHLSQERALRSHALMYSVAEKRPPSKPAVKEVVTSKPSLTPAPEPAPRAVSAAADPSGASAGRPTQAYVAIVLDDWGYNLKAYDWLEKIREPLTLAILPHLPYTHMIADHAHAIGHEIILHMPMEPDRDIPLEANTLLVGMSRDEIQDILNKAIDDVPHRVGFSNHMGSQLTADEYSMRAVIEVASQRNLLFLDSVTGHTVARPIVENYRMPYIARDIFLDNEYTEAYIRGQMNELIQLALANGHAIAIGHDHPETLKTIHDMLPELRERGIELVKLSRYVEIVNQP
jgi:hypothetical protein